MEQIEVLSQVIRNCQKADGARWPLSRTSVTGPAAEDKACQKVGVLVETRVELGKKLDLLADLVREGVEERVEVTIRRRGSQVKDLSPVSLIWRSRRS